MDECTYTTPSPTQPTRLPATTPVLSTASSVMALKSSQVVMTLLLGYVKHYVSGDTKVNRTCLGVGYR
jgi:hypothetical protein